jgi:hypothetical protein
MVDRVICMVFALEAARSMPNGRISMSKLKQLIALQSSNLSVRAFSRSAR